MSSSWDSKDDNHYPVASTSTSSSSPSLTASATRPRSPRTSLSPILQQQSNSSIGASGVANAVTARRQRSVHIHIKPDPAPPSALEIALPSWLQGTSSTGSGSSSSTTSATSFAPIPNRSSSSTGFASGSVPHRDFGMSPHRTSLAIGHGHDETKDSANRAPSHSRAASESSMNAHVVALRSLRSSNPSNYNNSNDAVGGTSASTRWAGLIRSQIYRIERDGLRRTFWSRPRQLGNRPTAKAAGNGGGLFANARDRLSRISEILWVESDDRAETPTLWQPHSSEAANVENLGDKSSDDTSDLLEDEATGSAGKVRSVSPSGGMRAARRAQTRRKNSRLVRMNRLINGFRRTLGISRASLLLLCLLLTLGIFETFRSVSFSSPRSQSLKPLLLNIHPKDPFKTLSQAGILLPSRAFPHTGVKGNAKPLSPMALTSQNPKTAAILLSWKRVENLVVILAHLCAFSGIVFDSIIIWNNNPDTRLTYEVSIS